MDTTYERENLSVDKMRERRIHRNNLRHLAKVQRRIKKIKQVSCVIIAASLAVISIVLMTVAATNFAQTLGEILMAMLVICFVGLGAFATFAAILMAVFVPDI